LLSLVAADKGRGGKRRRSPLGLGRRQSQGSSHHFAAHRPQVNKLQDGVSLSLRKRQQPWGQMLSIVRGRRRYRKTLMVEKLAKVTGLGCAPSREPVMDKRSQGDDPIRHVNQGACDGR